MEFNFVNLRIAITTHNAARLVSFLSAAGPLFAAAFRDAVCRTPGNGCSVCRASSACSYQTLFGQQLAGDPTAVRRYQKPPLPFIFTFPIPDDVRSQTRDLPCELVLVGNAIHHIDDFISALRSLLASPRGTASFGTARIALVESLDYQRNATIIAIDSGVPDRARVVTLDAAGVTEGRHCTGDMLGIRLLTPLKLVKDGQQMKVFDAGFFVRTLLRRVSSLSYYYCGLEMHDDFRSCSAAAGRLELVEDRFRFGRPYGSIGQSGIMGEGCLSGDFRDMMAFLALGEYLHLGKGAAYGMGSYQLF